MVRTKPTGRKSTKVLTQKVLRGKVLKAKGRSKTDAHVSGQRAKLEVVEKQKQKRKPGILALAEIRKYQRSIHNLVPRRPFANLVREILVKQFPAQTENGYRMKVEALAALQEIAECFLVTVFEDMNFAAIHAGRVTIMEKDSLFVKRFRSA